MNPHHAATMLAHMEKQAATVRHFGTVATRTDDASLVGKHVFEVSGCGVAPFRCVDVDDYGGTCDHCGAHLKIVAHIADANGKRFMVGRFCVTKTGDKGLIQAFKNAPNIRERNRQRAWNKRLAVVGELRCLIDANEAAMRSTPYSGPDGHLLGYAEWALAQTSMPSFQKRFLGQMNQRYPRHP